MSDDDLIRRGDALAAAAGLYKWSIAAGEELEAAIAALPAVAVGVPCTWPSCGHTAKGQCQGTGVRILSALEPVAAPDPALRPTMTDMMVDPDTLGDFMDANPLPPDPAAIREALLGTCACGMTGPCMWDQCKHPLAKGTADDHA